MIPDDQYTTLGASSGPDVPRLRTYVRMPTPPRFPHCDHGIPVALCVRCAESKRAYAAGRVRLNEERERAYRMGRLDGMARTAAVVLGLAVVAWWVGRGRR